MIQDTTKEGRIMETKTITFYSPCLERDMTIRVYGHYGKPILAFPCQDGNAWNLEDFGMINTMAPWIESGQIKVYVVDSDDQASYSSKYWDKHHRAWKLDQYFWCVINEVLPRIYDDCGGFIRPITFGCSLGADHATNMFFRRPDLFDGVLALSGCWDATYTFDGYSDDYLYENCPLFFLKNMPNNHYFIPQYNEKKIILCCGQGAYEHYGINNIKTFKEIFKEKGIQAWVDIWGFDVNHDWPWWFKQVNYFMPHLLGDYKFSN